MQLLSAENCITESHKQLVQQISKNKFVDDFILHHFQLNGQMVRRKINDQRLNNYKYMVKKEIITWQNEFLQ